MKKMIKGAWLFLLLFCTINTTNAQRASGDPILKSEGLVVVSPELFFAINDWLEDTEKSSIPLKQYLKTNQIPSKQIDEFYTAMEKDGGTFGDGADPNDGGDGPGIPGGPGPDDPADTGGNGYSEEGNCYCVPITVEPDVFESTPLIEPDQTNDDDSQGPNWLGNGWWRTYFFQHTGASQTHKLELEGNERGHEYTSQNQQSETRFYFLYLCRDDNDVACYEDVCEKEMFLRADYESNLSVEVDGWGIWSDGAFGKAEDAVLLYQWDHGTHIENLVAEDNILAAEFEGIEAVDSDNWNPEAFVNLIDLAGIVATGFIEGSDSSGIGFELNVDIVSDLADELGEIITTPFVLHSGTEGVTNETLSMDYEGNLLLKPNILKTISLVSTGQVYGRGYGGHWISNNYVSSCYAMTAIVKFNADEQICCVERSAAFSTHCIDTDHEPWSPSEGPTQIGAALGIFESIIDQTDDWLDIYFNEMGHVGGGGNIDIPYNSGIAFSETACPDPCMELADPDIDMETGYCPDDDIVIEMTGSENVLGYQLSISSASAFGTPNGNFYVQMHPEGEFIDGSPGIFSTGNGFGDLTPGYYNVDLTVRGNCGDVTTGTFHFRVFPSTSDFCTGGLPPGDDPTSEGKNAGFGLGRIDGNAEQFLLYPNPAVNQVTLHHKNLSDGSEIIINDVSGRVLFKQPVSGYENKTVINITDFLGGMYFVQITDVSGIVFQDKLLIIK